MGLDNFAYKRDAIDEDKFKHIHVLTGICAEGPTIRGKYYAPLVEELTGHSMYEELSESQVVEISEKLCVFAKDFKKAVSDKTDMEGRLETVVVEDEDGKEVEALQYCLDEGFTYGIDDVIHVAAWFQVVADEEGHVIAWY